MYLIFVLLVSCKVSDNIQSKEWRMVSYEENNENISLSQEIPTLLFSNDTSFSGRAGCNSIMGWYKTDGDSGISMKVVGSTMAFCPDMNFEDRYVKSLNAVDSYELQDSVLILKGGAIVIRYVNK